jgi:hypothetical protein
MRNSIWYQDEVPVEEWEKLAVQLERDIVRVQADEDRLRAEAQSIDDLPVYHNGLIRQIRRELEIVRNQGLDWEMGLVDLDGNLVNAKIVNGKFGEVWRIEKEDGSVSWVNVSVAEKLSRKQAFYASKGYELVKVWWRFAEGKYGWFALRDKGVKRIEKLGE